jgi:hypothetical protein
MFSNIYIYVYTICTKYFSKNNGYSTEYPWIKVGPPLPGSVIITLRCIESKPEDMLIITKLYNYRTIVRGRLARSTEVAGSSSAKNQRDAWRLWYSAATVTEAGAALSILRPAQTLSRKLSFHEACLARRVRIYLNSHVLRWINLSRYIWIEVSKDVCN